MVGILRVSVLSTIVAAGALWSATGARAAEDPAGYWATEKHESQIKITHCGSAICGSIFWMKDPNDGKGSLRLDKENEDEVKRKRPLLGLQLITMKPDEDHWKGTVYNPQNGKTYSATLKLLSKGEVEIEGCVAYVLCGGQKWTREDAKQTNTASSATPGAAHPAPKTDAAGKPAAATAKPDAAPKPEGEPAADE